MKTADITIAKIVKNLEAATNQENYVEALVDSVAELAITLLETTQAAKTRALEQIFDDYNRFGTIEGEYTVDMNKLVRNMFGKDSAEQLIKATVLKSFKGLWFGSFEENEDCAEWVQYKVLAKTLMCSNVKEPAIQAVWDAFCHALYLVERFKKNDSLPVKLRSQSILMKAVDVYMKKLSKFSEGEVKIMFKVDEIEAENGIKLVPIYEKADYTSMKEFIANISFEVVVQ